MSKPGYIFKNNIYWQLFTVFFRIGSFTIGGGYAMIPLIRKEVVDRKKWIGEKEFVDMLAMAQSAPGMIAVNTAIFVGYKIKGFRGSLATTLGSVIPAFLIILLIAMFFGEFRKNEVVTSVFKGIRPAVVALIAASLYHLSEAAGVTWKTAVIPLAVVVLIWLAGLSPVWIILATITGSIAYGHFKAKRTDKNKE
ncbi:MAG: chromate transporter [Bacteroidales bacterium]|jgi:chromate transporter|nr:chromate transporter [Bacteroidales bacterium]